MHAPGWAAPSSRTSNSASIRHSAHQPASMSRPSAAAARAVMAACQGGAGVIAVAHRRAGNPRGLLFSGSATLGSDEPAAKRARVEEPPTPSPPPPLAEAAAASVAPQPNRVVEAFKEGQLGFSFSAGGLLFPYYVGVVASLQEAGVLRGPAQMAGASAGSLIVACYNAGLPMRVVEQSMVEFGDNVLQHGVRGRLGPVLREFLHSCLPEDAAERCSGNTHVAMTRVLPYWRPQTVSHFSDRDDLISALLTSCHIPWYFDGRWMTKFRGHYCIDGGASVLNFLPQVPGAQHTVKVCCFPTWHLAALQQRAQVLRAWKLDPRPVDALLDVAISPDKFEEWPYDMQQVLRWALQASTSETSSYLIDKGRRDASAWVAASGLADVLEARHAREPEAAAQPVLHLHGQGPPPAPHSEEQRRMGERAAAAAEEAPTAGRGVEKVEAAVQEKQREEGREGAPAAAASAAE